MSARDPRRGPRHWASEIEAIVYWSAKMDIATAKALGDLVRRMRAGPDDRDDP